MPLMALRVVESTSWRKWHKNFDVQSERPLSWARDFRAVFLAAAIGVTLTAAVAIWLWRDARRLDHDRFNEPATQLKEMLDNGTEKLENLLHSLEQALALHDAPSIVDWDEFMNQVSPQRNFPGLL